MDKKNTGNHNTGNHNTGDLNTGHFNTGDYNTGHFNTGDCNTGTWNTGHFNTGSWNTVSGETGFFNTLDSEKVRVFNKWVERNEWEAARKPEFIYFAPTIWIESDKMSDKEKQENPTHETTGGYFKKHSYKESWANAYENATEEDIELLLALPNFCPDVFLEISGIDVRKRAKSDKAVLDRIAKLEAELEALKNELN